MAKRIYRQRRCCLVRLSNQIILRKRAPVLNDMNSENTSKGFELMTCKTLEELAAIKKEMLTAADVAGVLGSDPMTIRWMARNEPGRLGFPVIIVKNCVKIPKAGFMNNCRGRIAEDSQQCPPHAFSGPGNAGETYPVVYPQTGQEGQRG